MCGRDSRYCCGPPTSLASGTPRNPRERSLEYSRCAAFVMMVQATQLSDFDHASIDWRLRSSGCGSVFA